MSKLPRGAIWGLLFVVSVVVVAAGHRLLIAAPMGFVLDDSFFYAQIAYNIATTGRSTFDGLHDTSGYHLLWEGVLVGLSWLTSLVTAHKPAHMSVFLTASVFLLAVTAWLFGENWWQRALLLVLGLTGHLLLETLPLALLLLLFARELLAEERTRTGHAITIVVPLLVPLLRIDAAPIVLIMLPFLASKERWPTLVRAGGALTLGAVVHFGLMQTLFGDWLSVSSVLKAYGSVHYGAPPPVFNFVSYSLSMTVRSVLLVVLVVAAIALPMAHRGDARNRALLFLALGVGAFSVMHLLLSHMRYWYFVPGFICLSWVVFQVRTATPLWARVRIAVIAVLVVFAVFWTGDKARKILTHLDAQAASRTFLDQVPDHVPEGQAIYQVDGSGRTGWSCGRAVVNGDGLVNDRAYAQRMMAGELAGYLDEQGLCFILANRPSRDGLVVDRAGLIVREDEVELLLAMTVHGNLPDYTLYRRTSGACTEVR